MLIYGLPLLSQAGFSQVPGTCTASGWEAAAAGGSQPCDGCTWDGQSDCYDYSSGTWHGWPGVLRCDGQGRVQKLNLNSETGGCDGLAGTLSPCLAGLRGLRWLRLYQVGGGLTGEVPADLGGGDVGGLDELYLHGTGVDGTGCHSYCAAHPGTDCDCP